MHVQRLRPCALKDYPYDERQCHTAGFRILVPKHDRRHQEDITKLLRHYEDSSIPYDPGRDTSTYRR